MQGGGHPGTGKSGMTGIDFKFVSPASVYMSRVQASGREASGVLRALECRFHGALKSILDSLKANREMCFWRSASRCRFAETFVLGVRWGLCPRSAWVCPSKTS